MTEIIQGPVAVLTGAGISAESGVPTFRGEHGLWRNYRAEQLATPGAFHRDPALVWEWYDLLALLTQDVDVVLIDSPPVLPVADAVTLAQDVDGVLLVVDAGQTRREAARRAVESLRRVESNLLGVVINSVPTRRGGYYYYYRDYY